MKDKPRPKTGWPTNPDGSFTVGPGEDAWRAFCEVATIEQLHAALAQLRELDKRLRGEH
jgi:hypothetical protein